MKGGGKKGAKLMGWVIISRWGGFRKGRTSPPGPNEKYNGRLKGREHSRPLNSKTPGVPIGRKRGQRAEGGTKEARSEGTKGGE